MTTTVTVTVEGGGSFELEADLVNSLRSDVSVRNRQLAAECVGNKLRAALPPELPPEPTAGEWFAGTQHGSGRRVLIERCEPSAGVFMFEPRRTADGEIWFYWPDLCARYSDIRPLDLNR